MRADESLDLPTGSSDPRSISASSETESHSGHTGAEPARPSMMTLNYSSFCVYLPRTGVHRHAGILALLVTELRTSCMLDKPSAIPACSFLCFWRPASLKLLSLTTQMQVLEATGVPDLGIFLLYSYTHRCTLRFVTMWVTISLGPYSGLNR